MVQPGHRVGKGRTRPAWHSAASVPLSGELPATLRRPASPAVLRLAARLFRIDDEAAIALADAPLSSVPL